MENEFVINLSEYIKSDIKGMMGRPEGEKLLEDLKGKGNILKNLENQYQTIKIIIPPWIRLINKSYFLGFLETRIQELGREKFFSKYSFECERDYVLKPLAQYVEFALLTSSPEDILDV